MKEHDIRPDYMMKKIMDLAMIDINSIMQHKKDFIQVACPACESNDYDFCFTKNGFHFVNCNQCETLYINPRPNPELLNKFYNNSKETQYWNQEVYPKNEKARRDKIFAPRAKKVVELCLRYNVSTDVLLDVGAGFGTFCEEVSKLFFFKKVIAVEPSESLALSCQNKGIEVIQKPIEDLGLNPVNVITNFELIEHLFWPKDFIISCANALTTDGLLFLSTPNIKGFDLLTLKELSDNIVGPRHLNYFHPHSLKYLLEKCGFMVIEILTPGKLDAELVRKKILSNAFDISHNPFLKLILIEQWNSLGNSFQAFLAENLLSSHLWIVAQKKQYEPKA